MQDLVASKSNGAVHLAAVQWTLWKGSVSTASGALTKASGASKQLDIHLSLACDGLERPGSAHRDHPTAPELGMAETGNKSRSNEE